MLTLGCSANRVTVDTLKMEVILGIDRLDYMKGIPHKLKAFDASPMKAPLLFLNGDDR